MNVLVYLISLKLPFAWKMAQFTGEYYMHIAKNVAESNSKSAARLSFHLRCYKSLF